jgi:predicted HicB family RNase H-like nuclease
MTSKPHNSSDVSEARLTELVNEAEREYDVDTLLQRRRAGRPTIGSAAATVESVRLDPELKRDLLLRASEEKVSMSELIRRVLRDYVEAI